MQRKSQPTSTPAPKISCEHKTRKTRCRLCGGGSICIHNNVRDSCKKCLIQITIAKVHTGITGQPLPPTSPVKYKGSNAPTAVTHAVSNSYAATMPLRPVPFLAVAGAAPDAAMTHTAAAGTTDSYTSSNGHSVRSHPQAPLIRNMSSLPMCHGGESDEKLNGICGPQPPGAFISRARTCPRVIHCRRGTVRHGLPLQTYG